MKKRFEIHIVPNNNTLLSGIFCNREINFKKADSIGHFLVVEVPSHVIYLLVAVKTIDKIHLKIVDQDGNLVYFRGEIITLKLHIKSL